MISTTTNFCPRCGEELSAEAIDLQQGVAVCESCGESSRLQEVVEYSRPLRPLLVEPPVGCKLNLLKGEQGEQLEIEVSLHSKSKMLGNLFLAIFWNSITSIFACLIFGSLYLRYLGPLPQWLPFGEDQEPMGLIQNWLMVAFIAPFILIGLTLWWIVLLNLLGKVQLLIGAKVGKVRVGIGWLRRTWRFDPRKITAVMHSFTRLHFNNEPFEVIVLEGGKKDIQFGTQLGEEQREWLGAVLQQLLEETGNATARKALWERARRV